MHQRSDIDGRVEIENKLKYHYVTSNYNSMTMKKDLGIVIIVRDRDFDKAPFEHTRKDFHAAATCANGISKNHLYLKCY